jgi:flagellar hook-length control protein FliK
MTQIFPNISSLANFFIAQKGETKPSSAFKVPGFSLGDQWPVGIPSGKNTPELPAIPKTFDNPINQTTGFEDFLSSQIMFNSFMPGTLPISTGNNPDIPPADMPLAPIESISIVSIKAGQLKQLASTQTIPVTFEIPAQNIPAEDNSIGAIPSEIIAKLQSPSPASIPAEMPEYISANTDLELSFKSSQDKAIPDSVQLSSTPAGQTKQDPINAITSNPEFAAPAVTSQRITEPVKVAIDASKLFSSNDHHISVNVISADNKSANSMIISMAQIKDLVKKFAGDIAIQIKSESPITSKNINHPEVMSKSIRPESTGVEKNYQVNLNSLLESDNSTEIGVLQRIILVSSLHKISKPIGPGNEPSQVSIDSKVATPEKLQPVFEKTISENTIVFQQNPKSDKISKNIPQIKLPNENDINKNPETTKDPAEAINPPQTIKAESEPTTNFYDKAQTIMKSPENIVSPSATTEPLTAGRQAEFLESAKIVSQVKAQFLSMAGNTEMTIKLKPENLGRVKVNLRLNDNKLEAVFRVDNPEVKRVLDAELPRLRVDWKLDSYRVETGLRDALSDSGSFDEHHGQARTSNSNIGRQLASDDSTNSAKNKSKDFDTNKFGNHNRLIDLMA